MLLRIRWTSGSFKLVDDGLIQFGIGAFDGQLDFFVQLGSQVVHQPAEPFEGRP